DRVLLFTADYFTPVVDDPYTFGQIAAANAFSDVYAMGGQVVLALNIAAFPSDLPEEMVQEILRGGAEKVREAGGAIAGGHTIDDPEPKYGLAVMGIVHPDRVSTKAGARPGDVLVLTKPLGVGIITTAAKSDQAEPEHVALATEWMMRLNKRAAEIVQEFPIRGATDITGFALLGHASEMAERSGVRLRFRFADLPFLPGALRYADEMLFPGGANRNRDAFSAYVKFLGDLTPETRLLLFTPETSGGLLIAVPPSALDAFLARCREEDQPAWVVGEVLEGEGVEVVAGP
ncbi:MAG: selenide, water dikinase SelD, partial [Anaerolineae bacterium]